jgi:hypothetical protein
MPKKAFAYLTTRADRADPQKTLACDADHIFDASSWVSMLLVGGNEAFVQGARTMTGEIIHFQSHRDLKRGQRYSRLRISRTFPWSERRASHADDGEGDPQPDIDCETLDRMYRELNSGA